MSEGMEALARRAVACPGWRWMERMQVLQYGAPSTLCWLDKQGRWNTCDRGAWLRFDDMAGILPDLADPATLGCLLALVREVWGDPKMHAEPEQYLTAWRVWRRVWPMGMAGEGPTEAAALVAALETAPAKVAP